MTLSFAAAIHLTDFGIQSLTLAPAAKFSWVMEGSSRWREPLDRWMNAYAIKKPIALEVPLDLCGIPPFTQKALQELAKIPFGETRSYAQLARLIHRPHASRAVGQACGRNPILLIIPCHRIIASDGRLGGFSSGLDLKRQLLQFEKN